MNTNNPSPSEVKSNNASDKLINIISFAIPIAVALLIGIPTKIDLGSWTKTLPLLIGIINGSTSILLVGGLISIKQKNISLHRFFMSGAFILGGVFLVAYILYHISNPSTPFGGEGIIRPIYYFLLISHIVLSIGVVRLVLLAINHALKNRIAEHKKIVKWAFPIWLYVSTSGVLVYLMIAPYYK